MLTVSSSRHNEVLITIESCGSDGLFGIDVRFYDPKCAKGREQAVTVVGAVSRSNLQSFHMPQQPNPDL
jgi:hypothetical protein